MKYYLNILNIKTYKMEANAVKKDLYKSKNMAKLSHYVSGNLYYTVQLEDGVYQFPIATIESSSIQKYDDVSNQPYFIDSINLSSDLGTTTFSSEMKGSDLNRWITKAISKGEFIRIS